MLSASSGAAVRASSSAFCRPSICAWSSSIVALSSDFFSAIRRLLGRKSVNAIIAPLPIKHSPQKDVDKRYPRRSEIRRSEPEEGIADAQRPGAVHEVVIGDGTCGRNLPLDQTVELAGEFRPVTFEVELKVEAEAPVVPVGGADHRPHAVDRHHLRMIEGTARLPYTAAGTSKPCKGRRRGPVAEGQVVRARQNDIDDEAT